MSWRCGAARRWRSWSAAMTGRTGASLGPQTGHLPWRVWFPVPCSALPTPGPPWRWRASSTTKVWLKHADFCSFLFVFVCFLSYLHPWLRWHSWPSLIDTLSVCSNDSIMPGSSATLQPGHGLSSHTSPGPKRPGNHAHHPSWLV